MFNFRRRLGGNLADARHAQRWLSTLPQNDPLLVQRQLQLELDAVAKRNARRTPTVLAAVFAVDARTTGVVKTLMTQYADVAHRSAKVEDQLWRALFDLQQSYQSCYAAFSREIPDEGRQNRWTVMLPELIARQIVHLGHDARIRLYRCEPWNPAKWAELHAAFGRACAGEWERRPLALNADEGQSTIEREYLIVLLLQQADPTNMTPRQIEWVTAQLGEWCKPLRLTIQPHAAATFYVDLAGSAGLKRRSLGPLEGHVLFVDTEPLHALLRQKCVELEQAVKDEPRSDKTAQQREQLHLFVKLASRLSPEFKPLARRGERIPAKGAVDAIVGFANISGFLSEDVALPPGRFVAEHNYASTMDLAVFGHARVEPDNKADGARRRLAAFAAPGGAWEMKDLSVSGFRLHAPMSIATEVTLSMLVAIRRRGEEAWVLGIVRRMKRLTADNAEIGLQLAANTLTAGYLVEQRKAREADYSVEGDQAPLSGRRFRCLYLSYNRRAGDSPVQSLIIPPVEYQPAKRYSLQLPDSQHAVRCGRLLEQHTDWLWTVVETLEPDSPATDRPASP